MHDDIITACIDASDNIPSTRNNNNKMPRWNVFVKREKETALFWRSIWINNGSPRQGYVADNASYTRRAKLGQIQGGLQRAIQDSTKGGCNNFLLFTR